MEDQEKETNPQKAKYCKHCHAKIERHTNRCPFCGKKQWHPLPWTILAIIVAIIVLSIIFGRNTDETTEETTEEATEEVAEEVAEEPAETETPNQEEITEDSSNEQEMAETAEEPDDYIYVGETFTVNGLEITFDSYNDNYTDYTNDYWWSPPDDGYKYVTATFTYKNVKSSGTAFISLYDFKCYADNELMEQAYVTDTGDFTTANLSPDRTKTFSVAFAVPINSQSIELEYQSINYSRTEHIMKCK